jgi:hypothetical protein
LNLPDDIRLLINYNFMVAQEIVATVAGRDVEEGIYCVGVLKATTL